MTPIAIIKSIIALYMWLNMAVNPANIITLPEVERYFTPDFTNDKNEVITINSSQALFNQLNEMKKSGLKINFDLPLKEVHVSSDRRSVTVRYSITITDAKGVAKKQYAIGIWHIAPDGRFSRLNEINISAN